MTRYRFTAPGPAGHERTVTVDSDASSLDVTESRDGLRLRLRRDSGPIALSFSVSSDETLVGLGEQFVQLPQNGRRWRSWIADLILAEPRDTYLHVPMVLSSAGYATVVDSLLPCEWDLTASSQDAWSVTVPSPSVEVRIHRGTPKRIVGELTAWTGRTPTPPPWALGVWKTTLSGSDAVLRHAERLREEDVPVTACWVYDHYDEDTNSGCGYSGTQPRGDYPDLAALNADLHAAGYRTLGYVQPALFAGSRPYEEAAGKGWLVAHGDGSPYDVPFFNPKTHPAEEDMASGTARAAYVDLTHPDAAAWYAGLLAETAAQGWDGWMQDMGEHVPEDARFADGTSGFETHNRYALLYHQTAQPVWGERDDQVVFARSGVLRSLPLVTMIWPGDQACDWTAERGLPSVLPAGPSAGLAGVSTWAPDINGIVSFDGGVGAVDEELWVRWCQYGALHPVMRDHLGFKLDRIPVDLWHSPRTLTTFRTYADLHLRLVPYLHALAREHSQTGVPPIRALLLEYPEQAEAWTISDQYLLGDALLVAPVHRKDARARSVWFPPGEWVDWWSGSRYEGPAHIEVPAPLEHIPLFQRAGSVVPLLRDPDPRLEGLDSAAVELRSVS